MVANAVKAGFIFGHFFGGFWGFAPHLDNVTDDPGYSRLLADFSSVGQGECPFNSSFSQKMDLLTRYLNYF